MSKIVIEARMLNTSTGRYIERLLHYLQQIDHTNQYVVLLKLKDYDSWEPTNPNFSKMRCPFKEFTFAEQTGLLGQIKKLGADLVHFTMVQQPILYRGKVVTTMNDLTTVRFRNRDKNRLIFTVKQQIYKWVNKIAARKSKALITYTEYVREDVAKYAHVNSRKITVTHLAADAIKDPVEPVEELEGKKFIMYVGAPKEHKNLERLIAAYVLLKKSHKDLHLVLAGKKDVLYKRIAKKVDDAGIKDVVFTDFISDGQLKWLYEQTAAYVFPSLSEGFGLPGLEAMVAGAPVVSSNATCLPEVYGDAAEYFDPLDVDAMAAAVANVIDNPSKAAALKAKGRKQAARYSWKRTAEQTLAVYKQVLGEDS